MQLSHQQITAFTETVWQHYHQAARAMPWREQPLPYFVLVSELMLQQTQVGRVLPKFEAFIAAFPTVQALAAASLADVLRQWNGLGYNRRAKFVHQAAQMVVDSFKGEVPQNFAQLQQLPGVGKNTAGAIMAYAFNQPVIFIETNIRTVYFYHFFAAEEVVDDKQVVALLAQTLDRQNPREWYWALMDYGTHLKQTRGNNIRQSRHYARQSAFEGSQRQVRGAVLRSLLEGPHTANQLARRLPDPRLAKVLLGLRQEGFIIEQDDKLLLADEITL